MKSHLWKTILFLFMTLLTTMSFAEEVENTTEEPVVTVSSIDTPGNVIELPLSPIIDNFMLIYRICIELGMEQHIETLQGMLLQESSGGVGIFKGGISIPQQNYGIMQVRVDTARVLFRDNPHVLELYFTGRELRSLKPSEIKHLLIYNNEANVRLAALLYKQYWKIAGGNWIKTVAGYNMGIFKAIDGRPLMGNPYARGVLKYIREKVQPFNTQYGLLLNQPKDWINVSFAITKKGGTQHGKHDKSKQATDAK